MRSGLYKSRVSIVEICAISRETDLPQGQTLKTNSTTIKDFFDSLPDVSRHLDASSHGGSPEAEERFNPNCEYCRGRGTYRVEVPYSLIVYCTNRGAHCTSYGHTVYCLDIHRRYGGRRLCPCPACRGTMWAVNWYSRIEERECDCKGFY
jgi:excinuclease UvrABC ATPase subunit